MLRRLVSLSAVLAAIGGGLSAADRRPDVVFVLLDDLRWDALGYMNHPYVKTPHIDRLREQGAMMENAFVTTSICCPSRATFLTGTLANRHGVIDNETSEYNPEVTPPLTKSLQEAGYKTAMIGKWHMGKNGAPRPYFDYWLSFKGQGVYHDPLFNINGQDTPHQGYTTDLLTDYAVQFIKSQPKDQPYFCMLSHKAVHEPFQPAPRHREAFGADTVTAEPVSWSDDFAGKPDWLKREQTGDFRWDYRTRTQEGEQLPASIPLEPWKETNKYVDQLRCVAAVDEGIGRIVEALRERGTLDNTLIIFTSDNGYYHLEHRRWDKRVAYDEGLRIPMLVVYPGRIEAGSTVSQLVTNADFAPTVLSYAGVAVPDLMQGESMKPLFEQAAPAWRDAVFYEYWKELVHTIPTMTALRTDRHKLITYPEINDIDELYDLATDPHEMRNLAGDPAFADLHAALTARLAAARAQAGWQLEVFPQNLPRVRGPAGVLLDLAVEQGALVDRAGSGVVFDAAGLEYRGDSAYFDGRGSSIALPFNPLIDPSGWPFYVDIEVNAETDGIIAVQSAPAFGFKIFVQDGRPGVAVHCQSWIDTTTVIDAPALVLGKWTRLRAMIDYNRLVFWVDDQEVESVSLPLPFKGSPKTPLVIGAKGSHPAVAGLPDGPFAGSIRRITLARGR